MSTYKEGFDVRGQIIDSLQHKVQAAESEAELWESSYDAALKDLREMEEQRNRAVNDAITAFHALHSAPRMTKKDRVAVIKAIEQIREDKQDAD